MRTVMLDELTWGEVKSYLDRNDIAIIPIGVVELMGEWPLGIEYFTPLAISKMIAERIDGIVIPHIAYTFSGATRAGIGTVTLPIIESVRYVKNICYNLIENGFRRVLLLSFHGPAPLVASTVVRELFEEIGIPFAYIDLARGDLIQEAWLKEIWLGILKLLGKLNFVLEMPELTREQVVMRSARDPNKPFSGGKEMPKPMVEALKLARVGYFFTHESQHYPLLNRLSYEEYERLADEGISRLSKIIDTIEPEKLFEALKGYNELLEKNKMTERVERIKRIWQQKSYQKNEGS